MNGTPHNPGDNDLAADLQALVDAGLVEFHDGPGPVRRYGLTVDGAQMKSRAAERTARPRVRGHVGCEGYDWSAPAPCPNCLSTEGFDAGGRCRVCHVPVPPYM